MTDDLKIFRGGDYEINSKITLHQPTLGEISDYGEKEYFGLVRAICSTPADHKVDIYENLGIYWDAVDEFELFVQLSFAFRESDMSILFGDLDWTSFVPAINPNTKEIVLRNKDGVVIDRAIHFLITDALRKMHCFEKNVDVGYDEFTKDAMIEDEKDERELAARKPYSSFLLPLISSLTNCSEFKYRHDDVWTLPIGAFMDSVRRIQKRVNYDNLMHGVYSGCVEVKKIKKEEFNWMGELK